MVAHVKKVVDRNGENVGLAHFSVKSCDVTHSTAAITNNEEQKKKNSESNTKSHYFLNKLLSAADMNSTRKKEDYRYDFEIKYYATFLRMLIGPLAYEILQKNLMHCLPALP